MRPQLVNSGAAHPPQLLQAALALKDNALHIAEPLLKAYLHENPYSAPAIRMLAELAYRIGRAKDAEHLLRRALELAPAFGAARANLATLLYRSGRAAQALDELAQLKAHQPQFNADNFRAAVHNRLGEFQEALAIYEDALAANPNQPALWMSLGHVRKTLGEREAGVAAYRTALEHKLDYGEVWWSLANLKTFRFSAQDIAAMQAALGQGVDDAGKDAAENRFHLEFALGKAFEDAQDYAQSFTYYAQANAHRRALAPWQAATLSHAVERAMAECTADYFTQTLGHESHAPIFILGMPRAGSTLVEQILSCHSQVEAIDELPDIPALWTGLGDNAQARYAALHTLNAEACKQLGAEYLARAGVQRRTNKPYFIDKLPNNWLHIGFIKRILPHAKIIDVRRHPMACGFANFKQHFARGQLFSYDLTDIGRYYADYVRLMAHFDAVAPNIVQRVQYEQLVENTEACISALLAGLGLSFEQACVDFHQSTRAVRTPSSEQVRSAIYRSGMETWKHYAAWLAPLEAGLCTVKDNSL